MILGILFLTNSIYKFILIILMKEIINNPKNQFFFKHNYENIEERKIVNRSSGIFYFICSEDTKTELHFLNYLKEKRSLADVILRLTFRNMKGEILERTEEKIKDIVYNIFHIKKVISFYTINYFRSFSLYSKSP